MHYRVFISILSLHPLDASGIPCAVTINMSPDTAKCPLEGKMALRPPLQSPPVAYSLHCSLPFLSSFRQLHETRWPPILSLYHTIKSYLPNKIVSFLISGNCFSMVSSKDSGIEHVSRNPVKMHLSAHFFTHSINKHPLSASLYQALY